MINKEKMINELIENFGFKYEDSRELVDIIINKEGGNIDDIVNLYSIKGARWEEKEVINYINEGWDKKLTIIDILDNDYFYKLSSGLIVSWDY